jgi:hypothetical protein
MRRIECSSCLKKTPELDLTVIIPSEILKNHSEDRVFLYDDKGRLMNPVFRVCPKCIDKVIDAYCNIPIEEN